MVRVNQKEVFRSPQVTTQLLIGVAEQIQLPQAVGPAQIEIELEERDILETFDVESEGEFFIGINLDRDKIQFINSNGPFGYG